MVAPSPGSVPLKSHEKSSNDEKRSSIPADQISHSGSCSALFSYANPFLDKGYENCYSSSMVNDSFDVTMKDNLNQSEHSPVMSEFVGFRSSDIKSPSLGVDSNLHHETNIHKNHEDDVESHSGDKEDMQQDGILHGNSKNISSYASVLGGTSNNSRKVNFRFIDMGGNNLKGVDIVLPKESVKKS